MEIVRKNYTKHRRFFEKLLKEDDIDFIRTAFLQFNNGEYNFNHISTSGNYVSNFFDAFEKIEHQDKFCHFLNVFSDISEWVVWLLNSKTPMHIQSMYEKNRKIILLDEKNLLSNFTIDRVILKDFLEENLVTERVYNRLLDLIFDVGEKIVTELLLDYLPIYSREFSWKFLYIVNRYSPTYIKTCRSDLYDLLIGCHTESEKKESIKAFVESIIDIQDDTPMERSVDLNKQKFDKLLLSLSPINNGNKSISNNSNTPKTSSSISVNKNKKNESSNNDKIKDSWLDDLFGNSSPAKNKENKSVSSFSKTNTKSIFSLSFDDECEDETADKNGDEDDENLSNDKDMEAIMNKMFGSRNLSQVLDVGNNKGSDITLRKYQSELSQQGILGHNVMICSPTGSGKTIVALKIIEEHLKVSRDNKVTFIVPTALLVEQQGDYFTKFMKERRITKLTGGTKVTGSLKASIEYSDIVVMTADVLRNSLKYELDGSDELEYITITEFSMMVFDECHHCDKLHPYNRIMDFYFYCKTKPATTSMSRLPQIVGLTASTGTNKATKLSTALENLFKLCANLDCHVVCTVKQNIQELQNIVPISESEIIATKNRDYDEFEDGLQKVMAKIEGHLRASCRKHGERILIPANRFHDMYLNFIGNLNNQTSEIHNEELVKTFFVVIKYLGACYRAMIINHLFTYAHALEHIRQIEDQTIASKEEVAVRKLVFDFISNPSVSQSTNPALEELVKLIKAQLLENSESRIVVFVKEVSYTSIMVKEFEKLKLKNVRPKALVGQNKPSERGGLSKSSTDVIVMNFKQGIFNVLFTTTVAEEGLDVAECNLVIRYGHVTNETAMVQSRGRARMSDSRYLVIVPDIMNWQVRKEKTNQFRETFMYKAIEQFQSLRKSQVKAKLDLIQIPRITELRQLKSANDLPANFNDLKITTIGSSDPSLEIYCKHCLVVLCQSKDIKKVNSNYIVVSKEFSRNIKASEDPTNANVFPICCIKCRHVLGQKYKYNGYNVPNIKIQSILIQYGCNKKAYKQWSLVPFTPQPASHSEILRCRLEEY